MRRAAGIILVSGFAGMLLTAASAWAPMFFLSEVSPVPFCTRVWPIDSQRIGTVLENHYDWWLPVDRQQASVREGKIALVAADDPHPEQHDCPKVYFTGYDSWATSISASDVHASGPDWSRRLAHADDAEGVRTVVRIASGWPWRCVEGFETYSEPRDAKGLLTKADDGLIQNWRCGPLPYWPLLGGLTANVLVWSVAAAGAWTALRKTARWLVARKRKAAGRCGGCGYARLGLPTGTACPECGSVSA